MNFTRFLAVVAAVTMFSSVASADITNAGAMPATNVLYGQDTGNIGTRLIDEDVSSNHARGSFFTLAANATGYNINTISLESNGGNNNFVGTTASLSLFIFQGTQADFDAGTGHSTGTDGGNYYVDTTVTPLVQQTKTIGLDFSTAGDWLSFTLTNPLMVGATGGDFGFFFVYEQGDSNNDDFDHREGNDQGAATFNRSSITTTDHSTSGSRALNFVVQGEAKPVPEPSAMILLGLGAVGFASRRRR